MAMFTDSTRAPSRLPYVHRPAPPVQDPRTGDQLLAEITAELDRQDATATPEAARPRGRVARALAGAWHGIEADAERTREAFQAASA